MSLLLNDIAQFLKERLQKPLPGANAHQAMFARPVGDTKLKFEHTTPPKPGGVLILLYEQDGIVRFPLIKRPEYSGAHSGQISLPGGKAEPGEDLVITALREGEEEIGIRRQDVALVGKLSDFHVLPSNFLVTPVIATMTAVSNFVPDAFEVVRILSANVGDILRADAIKEKEIVVGSGFRLTAPHFEIDGEIVWGATAMILNEFRNLLLEM